MAQVPAYFLVWPVSFIRTSVNWGKERGQNPKIPDTSAIMSPVAHSLNKSQIEAVAAYVSTLK
jgi:hypothetical protein